MPAPRRKRLDQLCALRKHCAELDPKTARSSAATLDALQADIAAAVFFFRADCIESVPSCGCLAAACLCADMPELSTLGRR